MRWTRARGSRAISAASSVTSTMYATASESQKRSADIACLMVEDTVVRRFGTLRTPDDGGQSFTRGANDAEGRLRDLDADGVWGEVIYPNIAFFCCFEIRSAELQAASAPLYNDWV